MKEIITFKKVEILCPYCRKQIKILQITSGSERIDQLNQMINNLLSERQAIDHKIKALIKAEADSEFQPNISALFEDLEKASK